MSNSYRSTFKTELKKDTGRSRDLGKPWLVAARIGDRRPGRFCWITSQSPRSMRHTVGVYSRSAVALGSVIGAMAGASESFQPTLVPRSTLHQALVTAAMATTGAAVGATAGGSFGAFGSAVRSSGHARADLNVRSALVGIGVTAAAAAVGGFRAKRLRGAQLENYAEWGPKEQNPELAIAAGVAAAGMVGTAALGSAVLLDRAGAILAERMPGHRRAWTAGIIVLGAGIGTGLVVGARRMVFSRLETDSRAVDAALAEAPDDNFVTGGPRSGIDYDSLPREGSRFVRWRVRSDEINRLLGIEDAIEPVRVFIGIDNADTAGERVDLAIAEMDRLGAWERSAILAVSPAGSGYANSVPVEALEFYRHGDVTSVVVQYGLLPSMFSFSKRELAAETYRQLVDRISDRISQLPADDRPELFGFGESLGASTAQQGIAQEPSLANVVDATVQKLDAVVFVGTPGGPTLRDQLSGNPNSVHVDRWQDLPASAPQETQFWFLDHDADPVTRFTTDLLHHRPVWLAEQSQRGRNVPDQMRWTPLTTWQQVMFDVAYATQAQSGVFLSVGHDYRADLAIVVARVFAEGWDVDVPLVQDALVEREIVRDRLLTQHESP